jgi:hypothetical protein
MATLASQTRLRTTQSLADEDEADASTKHDATERHNGPPDQLFALPKQITMAVVIPPLRFEVDTRQNYT